MTVMLDGIDGWRGSLPDANLDNFRVCRWVHNGVDAVQLCDDLHQGEKMGASM